MTNAHSEPRAEKGAGSALYHRVMEQADDLMRKVWSGTPWMTEVYTERCDSLLDGAIRDWCYEQYGPEAWPIHGHAGKWHRGGATINGFTWFGFETEAMMNGFKAAFPK